MKTFSIKSGDIKKEWLLIDATGLVLGRLASEVAKLLRGKHKPTFTPHMDCGDNVVIVNAEKIHLTGKKRALKDGKIYYRHTGFPGGIKETTAGKILQGSSPENVIKLAVKRMITRNVLGKKQMSNLYVYAGSNHAQAAQAPKIYDFAKQNKKNSAAS